MKRFDFNTSKNRLNKKQLIVSFGILLVFAIIGISFALYNISSTEKIVVSSVVGEFTTNDFELAVYVDNKKQDDFPAKDSGYLFDSVTCENGSTGIWNANNWNLAISFKGPDSCVIKFRRETAGDKVIVRSPKGLDITTSYAGMYRFSGTDANNYVILSDGTNEVSYQIIGIVSEDNEELGLEKGQLKLIKEKKGFGANWHNESSIEVDWENSDIYKYLNDLDDDISTEVLNNPNIIPSGWIDKIASVKWYIGEVKTITNADAVFNLEKKRITQSTSKIALINLYDYLYAHTIGGTANCSGTCDNWLSSKGGGGWYINTITKYGFESNNMYSWQIVLMDIPTGSVEKIHVDYEGLNLPVFFLTNDVKISNPTATGSESDPFILIY